MLSISSVDVSNGLETNPVMPSTVAAQPETDANRQLKASGDNLCAKRYIKQARSMGRDSRMPDRKESKLVAEPRELGQGNLAPPITLHIHRRRRCCHCM